MDQVSIHDRVSTRIHVICKEFLQAEPSLRSLLENTTPVSELDIILEPALYVAQDALLTCTSQIKSGIRYIVPYDQKNNDSMSTIELVLTKGLELNEFRRLAMMH